MGANDMNKKFKWTPNCCFKFWYECFEKLMDVREHAKCSSYFPYYHA
jgi:hypothetical protein